MSFNFITKILHDDFPNLTYLNSKQTSDLNDQYNCIAWALENNENWIWPDQDDNNVVWPRHIARIRNKTTFIALFEFYGYRIIPNKDSSLEKK
jgi:hypothetical protein